MGCQVVAPSGIAYRLHVDAIGFVFVNLAAIGLIQGFGNIDCT